MAIIEVDVHEFGENLIRYLESKAPVAIVRNGTTIGTYVPVGAVGAAIRRRPKPAQADVDNFCIAAEQFQALIATDGITPEELIADFEQARKETRASRRRSEDHS